MKYQFFAVIYDLSVREGDTVHGIWISVGGIVCCCFDLRGEYRDLVGVSRDSYS